MGSYWSDGFLDLSVSACRTEESRNCQQALFVRPERCEFLFVGLASTLEPSSCWIKMVTSTVANIVNKEVLLSFFD